MDYITGQGELAPMFTDSAGLIRLRIELLFRHNQVAPQKARILRYLLDKPGALTHCIAADCRVSYPPSVIARLNKALLAGVGLRIERLPPRSHKNAYGERCAECGWKLSITPDGC